MTIPVKHFYMIRHGQTEANAARIMAGSLDSPLTALGREQARIAQLAVKSLAVKPKRIIHSHLSRARDTAAIINEALNLPMHEDVDYAEMDAGHWEGAPYDQCKNLLTDWVDSPGGESYQGFFERIRTAKNRAMNHDAPVLVVSHGGVFRAFLKLYGIHKEGVQNCKLYEFTPKETAATNIHNAFPWDVWRYEVECAVTEKIQKISVRLDDHPASEISA